MIDIFMMFKDVTWWLAVFELLGNVFNVKKKVICFYIWSISEILWMALDIYNKVYGRAFLDLTQLLFALWGIYQWQVKDKIKRVGAGE